MKIYNNDNNNNTNHRAEQVLTANNNTAKRDEQALTANNNTAKRDAQLVKILKIIIMKIYNLIIIIIITIMIMTLIKYIHWVALRLDYATIFTILTKRIYNYIFRKLKMSKSTNSFFAAKYRKHK